MPNRETSRIPALAGIAAAATAAFAGLTVLQRDRRLSKPDKKALAGVARRGENHAHLANALHPLGKWWTYLPAAVAAGAVVYAKGSGGRRERVAGAAAVPLAAIASAMLNPLFDAFFPQPA